MIDGDGEALAGEATSACSLPGLADWPLRHLGQYATRIYRWCTACRSGST